jgi:hypothetical protein
LVSLYLAAIGIFDSDHFLPLQTHSDFGFQIFGEALELLAVASLFGAIFWSRNKISQASAQRRSAIALCFLAGGLLSVVFIAISWRDFFPGDKFQYVAGIHRVIGAVIGGVFFGILAFHQAGRAEPLKPEETSAF